jgi:hypothetical protein
MQAEEACELAADSAAALLRASMPGVLVSAAAPGADAEEEDYDA